MVCIWQSVKWIRIPSSPFVWLCQLSGNLADGVAVHEESLLSWPQLCLPVYNENLYFLKVFRRVNFLDLTKVASFALSYGNASCFLLV